MIIRSVTLGVGAEGTGKFGVTGKFKLLSSFCSSGSGTSIGLGAELRVGGILIVNYVGVPVAELERDTPIARNPDGPTSFARFWPHRAQPKPRNVHITNVRCCI
jgi:hypothetical protein